MMTDESSDEMVYSPTLLLPCRSNSDNFVNRFLTVSTLQLFLLMMWYSKVFARCSLRVGWCCLYVCRLGRQRAH